MGVVKRIAGWRDSRWPIPNTLQMLVGLIPYRDPEAFAERKRAAMQAEAKSPVPAAGANGPQRELPAVVASPLSDLTADDPDLGDELPVRAADGWYRYGRTFYPIGGGPFAGWGFPEPPRPAATRQGMLF